MNSTFPDNNTYVKMVRCLAALAVSCIASLVSGNAFAENYYWNSGNYNIGQQPSAVAACKALVIARGSPSIYSYHATQVSASGNTASCKHKMSEAYGGVIGDAGTVLRQGTSCPSGTEYNPTTGACGSTAPESCGAYPTKEIAANNSWANVKQCACTWNDAQHLTQNCSCKNSVTNRPTNFDMICRGVAGDGPLGLTPASEPNPPPETEVAFPECPVGSYKFTDLDGHSECSTPVPNEVAPQPCASGNAGSFNGNLVCLPKNPAPDSAAVAAATAKLQAAIAKQFAATSEAAVAATKAAAEAQKAKDASDSLPNSAPTKNSLMEAVAAAKQAAGYAGTPYNGPSAPSNTSGSGSGGEGENEGAKECGSPGKPKCLIDESGTPTGAGTSLDAAKTALQTAVDGVKTSANEAASGSGKDTSLGWMPNIPEGQCTEVELPIPVPGGGSMQSDICKWTAHVTVGFELLWAAFFGFAVMSMVAAATSKAHA